VSLFSILTPFSYQYASNLNQLLISSAPFFTADFFSRCPNWIGYDCYSAEETWGYSAEEELTLLSNCPFSCKICPTLYSVSPTAYPNVSPSPTLSPTPTGCVDGILNGDETDVDCGGRCIPCALGSGCAFSSDCVDGRCDSNICVVFSPTAIPTSRPTPSTYKIVVLGDIKGDFEVLSRMLRQNGVLSDQMEWVDQTTKVISLGDTIGWGHQDKQVLEFIKDQSERNPWFPQLGDQEYMQLTGDFTYAFDRPGPDGPGPRAIGFGTLGKRRKALKEGSNLGDWLRGLPSIQQEADNIFVHAGMRPHNIGRSLKNLNADITSSLVQDVEDTIMAECPVPAQVEGLYSDGVWYDAAIETWNDLTITLIWTDGDPLEKVQPYGNVRSKDTKCTWTFPLWCTCVEGEAHLPTWWTNLLSNRWLIYEAYYGRCEGVNSILQTYNVSRIIVAHTSIHDDVGYGAAEPLEFCNGGLLDVEVGISRWEYSNPVNLVLNIEDGKTTEISSFRSDISDLCTDNGLFRDDVDLESCARSWKGYNCNTAASDWGYTEAEQHDLLNNCPFTCGLCSAEILSPASQPTRAPFAPSPMPVQLPTPTPEPQMFRWEAISSLPGYENGKSTCPETEQIGSHITNIRQRECLQRCLDDPRCLYCTFNVASYCRLYNACTDASTAYVQFMWTYKKQVPAPPEPPPKPCHGDPTYPGDGYCDDETNSLNCEWDGGDCCIASCVDAEYDCGENAYDCIDPEYYSSYGGEYGSDGQAECPGPRNWPGDGYCDGETNRPSCDWDAGDCCIETCVSTTEYECGENGYDCRDPQFSNFTRLECLPGGPDLVVNQDVIRNTLSSEWLDADNVDVCYVEEGCLGGTGSRHLLRFSSRIANIGCEDFYIGFVPETIDDEATSGFVWHTCHEHWHYEQYAYYSLNEFCDGKELAWETRPAVGHKNGWCVMDLGAERGLEHVCGYTYDCDKMGISAGCWDEYEASLDCQWVDITDIQSGSYWLMVATNWDEEIQLPELNYTNNAAWVAVQIEDNGSARALSEGEVAQLENRCPASGSMGAWRNDITGVRGRRL